jgi:hypothetical protein
MAQVSMKEHPGKALFHGSLFRSELKQWWKKSYGYELNYLIACALLAEMLKNMDDAIVGMGGGSLGRGRSARAWELCASWIIRMISIGGDAVGIVCFSAVFPLVITVA